MAYFEGLYFLAPIFVLYLAGNGIDVSLVIFSQTLYSIGVFSGEVPTGIFGDHYGQKLSLLIGYTVEFLAILLIFLFPIKAVYLILSFIRGFGASFSSGSDDALLYESAKVETKGKDFEELYVKTSGIIGSNIQIGVVISTALAGLVYKMMGEKSFSLLIIATLVCVAVTALLVSSLKDYSMQLRKDEGYKEIQKTSIEGSAMLTTLREAFSLIKNETSLKLILVVSLVTMTGEYFLQSVYPPYFQMNHVDPLWIGLVLTIGALVAAFVSRNISVLEKRFSVKTIITFTVFVVSLCYITLARVTSPVLLVAIFIGMSGLFKVVKPFITRVVNSKTPSAIRATVLSGFSFSQRIVQTLFYWLIGLVVASFNVSTSILLWGIYLLIGSLISYLLLSKIEKKKYS